MKIKDALKITDSFTKTSKMPGLSYSACRPGSVRQDGSLLRFLARLALAVTLRRATIQDIQQSKQLNIEG